MRGRGSWASRVCAGVLFAASVGCSGGKAEVKDAEVVVAERELAERLPERSDYVARLSNPDCVRWKGYKETGAHLGGFEQCVGFMSFDAADTLRAVEVEVDVSSLITDYDKLRQHLLSSDFLEVKRFPKAAFKSMAVRPLGDSEDGARYEIVGAMTIKGVTRRITVEATVARVEGAWVARSEFTLPRFDYGITYVGKADDEIHDDVNMVIELEAPYDPSGLVAEEVGP